MQLYTIVLLVCLGAIAAYGQHAPAYDAVNIAEDLEAVEAGNVPAHERSARTKRGLLLLKKKLLLGVLGLKAVKAAKIGAVGVAGALALKAKGRSAASASTNVGGAYSYGYSRWN